jgi:hypothetical protein
MRELVARTKKSLLAAAVCAAVAALSAGPALAGEVTGSGANEKQNQGMSWCSFSGLNDDPGAPLDGTGPERPRRPLAVLRAGEQAGSPGSAPGESRHVLQSEAHDAAAAAEPEEVTTDGWR